MKLLALDFDGVISDSAPESFVVALRTYCELRSTSRIARVDARLERSSAGVVRRDAVYRRFLELMPLGNRAEDFGVALSVLESELTVADQAAYDRARAAEGEEFLATFHRRFYEVRAELRQADPKRWAELLAPYTKFTDILRRRAGEVDLALATAKDRDSVLLLLRDYAVADLFPPERILDKEAGAHKTAHLTRLRERTGVAWADITFVDDKVNHLAVVAPLGVRCALAAWGYNGRREWDQARASGHLVCTLADFEAQVFA